jgi:hypothetical protein
MIFDDMPVPPWKIARVSIPIGSVARSKGANMVKRFTADTASEIRQAFIYAVSDKSIFLLGDGR